MLGSLSTSAEHRIADEVPWVRPPADLESGKEEAEVFDYGDRTLRITSEQVLCSRPPLPPGWGYKIGHLAGWGAHGENPVEVSGFLLASLAGNLSFPRVWH